MRWNNKAEEFKYSIYYSSLNREVKAAPLPVQSTVLIKGGMLLRFIYAHMEVSLLEEHTGKAVKACGELNRSHNKIRSKSSGKLPKNSFFITINRCY